tara:strand:+ start:2657 stop:2962 length:306 start_codon:yes stop_codon:yes gene_type:complete
MYDKHNYLNILRQLGNLSKTTQREMASNLGYSLGKLNYCLKELKKKGLIKISNFRKNTNRQKYIYVLTPKGISYRTKLTINYMKQKMKEYDELKKELNKKN